MKVYIVDDEPLARDELRYLLNQSKQVTVLGESDCIEDAVKEITEFQPDLVFLDIELEEGTGIELAGQLKDLEHPPAIVFATAYDEYALQAFEADAVDYILKPFEEERILHTLEKIDKLGKIGKEDVLVVPPLRNDHNGKMAFSVEEKIVLIPYTDILFVESSEGKCIIHTLKQEYKVSEPLVEVEKRMNFRPFLRVHRSYVVNLEHIDEIEPWFNSTYNLMMNDGSKVPVSRTYIKDLKKVIGF